MRVQQKAGQFEIEYWTDGYPHWISVKSDGREVLHGLQISDIHDLHYACQRIIHDFPGKGA